MILMDGGCEFNGYASDITRTWPVDGKFTKEQGTIYGIVLEVQKICLKVWLQFFFGYNLVKCTQSYPILKRQYGKFEHF